MAYVGATAFNDSSSPKTVAAEWAAGDVLYVWAGNGVSSDAVGTPTAPGLTFEAVTQQDSNVGTEPESNIWKAVAGSSGSGNVSIALSSSLHWGFCVWKYPSGTTEGSKGSNLTESVLSLAVAAGSDVLGGVADWNATPGSSAPADGSGTPTERIDGQSAHWRHWAGDWTGVSEGTFGFGLASYAGLRIAQSFVEVIPGTGEEPPPDIFPFVGDLPVVGASVGDESAIACYLGSSLVWGAGITGGPPPVELTFPTAATSGVPAGWSPASTVGTQTVSTPGAVLEDLEVNGDIQVQADNVTIRRCRINNGVVWNNFGGVVHPFTIEDSSLIADNGWEHASFSAALGVGSFSADHVVITGHFEGVRSGRNMDGSGPITMNYVYVECHGPESGDWHGDGLQGYLGSDVTMTNCVVKLFPGLAGVGTSPVYWPDDENGALTADGLIVEGGGYAFRLGQPGENHSIERLYVVEDSYAFGPILVGVEPVMWSAWLCDLDVDGQPIPGEAIGL